MKLEEANLLARYIVDVLSPHCERIHIAGSVRRKKPEVKDIEIVCEPIEPFAFDIFGDPVCGLRSQEFVNALHSLGDVIKGNPNTGRYCQVRIPAGDNINIDIFMPEPDDYFRQLAIRTGSADYSQKVIATGWRRKGWVGTDQGLRLEKECEAKELSGGKKQWKCIERNPTLPPVWQSEEELFEWIGVKWIEPQWRSI